MIKIFEVGGSHYDMGLAIGRQFKHYLDGVMPIVCARVPKYRERISALQDQLRRSMPNCLDEILGRADGAETSREAMLLYMFPEICGGVHGCTTVAYNKGGRALFAHNEDDVDFVGEDVALVKYNYEDGFVFAYTMASRMAGSAFAFNSYGLAFSSNHIFGGRLQCENISRFIVLRDIINSKSIEEVRRKLSSIEVASPFSLNVLDVRTAEMCNFEKDISDLAETPIRDRYARSNHFLTREAFCAADVPVSSLFRREKTAESISALGDDASIDDLVRALEYEGDSFDTSVYEDRLKYPGKLCTVATFAVDGAAGTYTVYDRIYGDKLVFDANANLVLAEHFAK